MARPRQDGRPSRESNRRKLTDNFVERLKPEERHYLTWDERIRGLVIVVYPSGTKVWKVIYSSEGRLRWYTIGTFGAIDLSAARKIAQGILLRVAEGSDPQAEKAAKRGQGTFEELVDRYFAEHARKHNRSWQASDRLIRRNIMPRWAKLRAASITRADVKAAIGAISSEAVANQTLRNLSPIFNWGVKEEIIKANPCSLIDQHKRESRERVLSDTEIPIFWRAFDSTGLLKSTALKLILLLGQRPGEVLRIRREHIKDGWWEMPGRPVPALNWPGTKNGGSHRVWLPRAALDLLDELDGVEPFGLLRFNGELTAICRNLKVERATPHDLRRTHGTTITALGFGREAMNRIQNHKEGGIASVYDRHSYSNENKRVMESVAARITALVNGDDEVSNVVKLAG
jgi:integrase